MIRKILFIGFVVAMVWAILPSAGITAETVKIGIVCELSGSGAPAGMRWQRGILMAVDEINAADGILGRQIETFSLDSKTEPPVSVAAMKKAIEKEPYVVMGTVYSSSTVVNMSVLQKAGIPQFTGSTAPPIAIPCSHSLVGQRTFGDGIRFCFLQMASASWAGSGRWPGCAGVCPGCAFWGRNLTTPTCSRCE